MEENIELCVDEEQKCVDEADMPTAMEMAKNLMKDGGNILSNAIKGNPTLVPDEVRESRWDICLTCPMLQNNRCSACGCFMKVKVSFHTSKCPEGKW